MRGIRICAGGKIPNGCEAIKRIRQQKACYLGNVYPLPVMRLPLSSSIHFALVLPRTFYILCLFVHSAAGHTSLLWSCSSSAFWRHGHNPILQPRLPFFFRCGWTWPSVPSIRSGAPFVWLRHVLQAPPDLLYVSPDSLLLQKTLPRCHF